MKIIGTPSLKEHNKYYNYGRQRSNLVHNQIYRAHGLSRTYQPLDCTVRDEKTLTNCIVFDPKSCCKIDDWFIGVDVSSSINNFCFTNIMCVVPKVDQNLHSMTFNKVFQHMQFYIRR